MGRPRKNHTVAHINILKKPVILEGLFDIVTSNDALWDIVIKKLARQTRFYGFSRFEGPLIENKALYEAFYKDSPQEALGILGISDNSQAVLRPNILPSLFRTYFENKIYEHNLVSKWAYSGMSVKYTNDNILSSDYEFGFEIFGNFTHLAEAQVVSGVWDFLLALGLEDLILEINNIGNSECQKVYAGTLSEFLGSRKYELCDACNRHLQGRVLNVFRCQNLDCQAVYSEAPTILDFLDSESHKHFTNILEALDEMHIPYQLNASYVGPSGHGKLNFAIQYKTKAGAVIIGEGGNHEGLMQNLSGKNYCCFGFNGSLKKIYELLRSLKLEVERESRNEVFLVPLGELAAKKSLRLFSDLIRAKIMVYDHFGQGGVKNQLKMAETNKAPIALIMGQKEAVDEMVILRDVKSGMQEIISYDKIVEEVKKRLGK